MTVKELCKKNRSIRKFDENYKISKELLLELVDTARLCPSGGNVQPLRYLLCWEKQQNDKVFPLTNWARLLKDYHGPQEGERPTAYIVICVDKTLGEGSQFSTDVGIAAQSILLAAVEKGLGGCMIGSFHRQQLIDAFSLPETIVPMLVLALGKPDQRVFLEEMAPGASTAYYRDSLGHHVPKRRLEDIVL